MFELKYLKRNINIVFNNFVWFMSEILRNYSFLALFLSVIFSFIRTRKSLVISTIFIGITVAVIQQNIEPIGIIFPLMLFLSSYIFTQKTTNKTVKFYDVLYYLYPCRITFYTQDSWVQQCAINSWGQNFTTSITF
jgi:hypothetical protein